MKEAIVSPGLSVALHDVDIPSPGPNEVLIKIVVSGSNPKDWKIPEMSGNSMNTGDDMAGTIEAIGSNVVGFHKGDRVAAFHTMRTPHGSFAEYGIAWADSTFHLPPNVSYEEGATIPLAAMTAAVGLFDRLGLPEPWTQGRADGGENKQTARVDTGPLLVYGAASAVGAFVIQLAKRASIGPIIAVAGKGIPFVEGLLDSKAGDKVIDYRNGDEGVVKGIKEAIPQGAELRYCYDAVSEKGSYINAANAMVKDAKITLVLPTKDYSDMPGHMKHSTTMVGDVHGPQTDFGAAWFPLFGKGLREGWFKPHPHTVVAGGLNGVEEGLKNLMNGKASATKYVFRIAETPGVTR